MSTQRRPNLFRRVMRRSRLIAVLVSVFVSAAALIVSAAPAQASNVASAAQASSVNCVVRSTPFKWLQSSCLEYYGPPLYDPGLEGYGEIYLQTGFSRPNVRQCTAYLQLTSSYIPTGSAPVSFDCTAQARAGGVFTFPHGSYSGWDWGPGRYCGDTYYQYAWIVVKSYSGAVYDGRPYAAKTSVVKCS